MPRRRRRSEVPQAPGQPPLEDPADGAPDDDDEHATEVADAQIAGAALATVRLPNCAAISTHIAFFCCCALVPASTSARSCASSVAVHGLQRTFVPALRPRFEAAVVVAGAAIPLPARAVVRLP